MRYAAMPFSHPSLSEVIEQIETLNRKLAGFWKAAHGWAPIEAAGLLSKARLNWQVSLSSSLRLWLREPSSIVLATFGRKLPIRLETREPSKRTFCSRSSRPEGLRPFPQSLQQIQRLPRCLSESSVVEDAPTVFELFRGITQPLGCGPNCLGRVG
jgi:hypothetical protein